MKIKNINQPVILFLLPKFEWKNIIFFTILPWDGPFSVVRLTSLSWPWIISQSHQPSCCCWGSQQVQTHRVRLIRQCWDKTLLCSFNCCNNSLSVMITRAVKAVTQWGDWRGCWFVSPSQGQCRCEFLASLDCLTDWPETGVGSDHSNPTLSQSQSETFLLLLYCC